MDEQDPAVLIIYQVCHTLYIHYKTYGMGGNAFMCCGSSPKNIHQSENALVVFQLSPNLVPQLGCSETWMNRTLVC